MPRLAARPDDADRDLAAVGDRARAGSSSRTGSMTPGASRGTRACLPGLRATRGARAMRLGRQVATSRGCRPATSRDQRFGRGDGASGADVSSSLHVLRRPSRSSSAAGTTAWTRPISRARAAENRAPVRNSSRAADSADLRDDERRDHRRQDAELHLGEPEHRVLGGDDDVADRGEAGAAAERGAVDAADQRHRQRVERLEHRAPSPARRGRSRRACSRPSSTSTSRSAPAQNTLPAPRSTATARRAGGRHRLGPRRQLRDQLLVERVAHLRPVQRDATTGPSWIVATSLQTGREEKSEEEDCMSFVSSCLCLRDAAVGRQLTSGRRRTSRPESAR